MTCSVTGCALPVECKGLCNAHYIRHRKGRPMDPPVRPRTVEERFWSRVDKLSSPNGCWLWTGSRITSGYGRITFTEDGRERLVVAHRWSYEALVGPIPDGLVLDHLCRVRHCVNPAHLEPVTQFENVMRGFGVGALASRQTHCVHGHEFTPENTHIRKDNGQRVCRACTAEASRRHRARARAAVAS